MSFLPHIPLVPPIRCPVEPLIHSPERIEATRVGGVCVVDDAIGECERAHAPRLVGISGDVGTGHGREIAYAHRVRCRAERVVVVFDAARALLFLSDRGVEVIVEIAIQWRGPRKRPTHAALVGQKCGDWGAWDREHRDVVMLKVHGKAVKAVRDRRACRAAACVIGAEHEVIYEDLRASSEQLVLLLDRY